jgi:hypothetical protein
MLMSSIGRHKLYHAIARGSSASLNSALRFRSEHQS